MVVPHLPNVPAYSDGQLSEAQKPIARTIGKAISGCLVWVRMMGVTARWNYRCCDRTVAEEMICRFGMIIHDIGCMRVMERGSYYTAWLGSGENWKGRSK